MDYYEDIFRSNGSDPIAAASVLDSVSPRVTPAPLPMMRSKWPCFKCIRLNLLDLMEVLSTGRISQESNFTHLTLIPKIKDPKYASDLRPIALCNVVYKIASMVLANRLKSILPEVISPLQSGFVPGTLISDNTLVASEVAHFMKRLRRQVQGFFSLKLDISKAYDRLEWSFLEAVLLKLGFCQAWIDIVRATVKSLSYSILINGVPTGFILPDPQSPYLFILAAESLSSLISASHHLCSSPFVC
ncbi:hypothetical protein ACLB2K_014752 [Fragaria x ananassa]